MYMEVHGPAAYATGFQISLHTWTVWTGPSDPEEQGVGGG